MRTLCLCLNLSFKHIVMEIRGNKLNGKIGCSNHKEKQEIVPAVTEPSAFFHLKLVFPIYTPLPYASQCKFLNEARFFSTPAAAGSIVPVYNNIPKIDIDFWGNILSLATGYMMIYHIYPQ